MQYMLIMRETDEALEASEAIPFEQILEAMGKYNESMMEAGVMIGGEGLSDASEGFVVDFDADPPLVTDGPYGETKELFNGFWLLEVSSKEEAAEWAKRCPLGHRVAPLAERGAAREGRLRPLSAGSTTAPRSPATTLGA